jgi:hypothetical protein
MTDRSRQLDVHDLPNGPVAAALLAGGIGSAAVGLTTLLSEASASVANAMNWYKPVGPLSGKTSIGVIIFFLSWILLHAMYRGKNVDFNKFATFAFILLGIGLLFTFPPFFMLFAAE